MLMQNLLSPCGVLGCERGFEREPVIEQVITASFMALVNHGLQVHERVGIGRPQRNANDGQPLTQWDRICLALVRACGPKDTDPVAGARALQNMVNCLRKKRGALT